MADSCVNTSQTFSWQRSCIVQMHLRARDAREVKITGCYVICMLTSTILALRWRLILRVDSDISSCWTSTSDCYRPILVKKDISCSTNLWPGCVSGKMAQNFGLRKKRIISSSGKFGTRIACEGIISLCCLQRTLFITKLDQLIY